jgi:hypothetical protein
LPNCTLYPGSLEELENETGEKFESIKDELGKLSEIKASSSEHREVRTQLINKGSELEADYLIHVSYVDTELPSSKSPMIYGNGYPVKKIEK